MREREGEGRTPRGDHVVVEQGGHARPEDRASLDRLEPEEEGAHEDEDGDRLVVVAAGDAARDVARRDGDEEGGPEARRLAAAVLADLLGEEVGRERREARKGRRELDAHLADVDRDRDEVQRLPDEAACHHEARVQRAADDATEGVPGGRVEPVPEGLLRRVERRVSEETERRECGESEDARRSPPR